MSNKLIRLGEYLASNGISSEYSYYMHRLEVFIKADSYCYIFYEYGKYKLYYPRERLLEVTDSMGEIKSKIKDLRA